MRAIQALPLVVLGLTVQLTAADTPPPDPTPRNQTPSRAPTSGSDRETARSSSLLVAGSKSDNIVRFNLGTGKATVIAKLANGARPRSLAVSPAGVIFVGLRGNALNIVKLVSTRPGGLDSPLVAVDVTRTIGRFGPGLMAFDRDGFLYVAGDTERAVLRFDVRTGELVGAMRLRAANLVGLAVSGVHVYAAEYFQRTVLRFDLAVDPPEGAKFICKADQLNRPHGLTVGHNGNLFVANLQNSLISEFNHENGEFVGPFLDTRTIGVGHVNDLCYASGLNCYFFSSGDSVFELSSDGAWLGKYESEALSGAEAIAVLPRVSTAAAPDAIRPGAGLIGRCTVSGKDSGIVLRYEHGKIFQPAILTGTSADPARARRGVRIVFRGHLTLAKPMTVRIWLAGGSSNGGHTTLRVGDNVFGPLGDDNRKSDIYPLQFPPGEHTVVWTLTGGDFGCSMLKFQDSASSRLLPISFTSDDVAGLRPVKLLQVSSDEGGWPIPQDWPTRPSPLTEAF